MKIYTKKGDSGNTSLIGGKRVSKSDKRIEAYGTVDELIAFTGLLRDQQIKDSIKTKLIEVQDKLMICASILAADCDDCKLKLPALHEEDITFLENEIDEMEKSLMPLQSFILPGGHQVVSICHVARTICRRAERRIAEVNMESQVPDILIKFINRLSDYFFVLSRYLSSDFQIDEIKWISKVD